MSTIAAKTPFILLHRLRAGELDVFDALEAAPEIVQAATARSVEAEQEEARLLWLEQYELTGNLDD